MHTPAFGQTISVFDFPRRQRIADPNHAVARHQTSEFLLIPALGAIRALRQNQVAQIRIAVMDANLLLLGNIGAELTKDRARLADCP